MSRTTLIKRITFAVFIAVACNLVWTILGDIAESLERERLARETGWTVCTFGPPRDSVARFHITLLLILPLVGSRLKGLSNTLLNVIGLTGAVVSYIFWWQYIFRIARNAEVSIAALDPRHYFAYLAGGNVLDIAIAAAIGVLVILNIRSAALSSFRVDVND